LAGWRRRKTGQQKRPWKKESLGAFPFYKKQCRKEGRIVAGQEEKRSVT